MLEQIQSPADLKGLAIAELQTVVDQSRQALLEKISRHGGHNGPNLGVSNLMPLQIELLQKYVKQPLVFNQLQLSIEQSRLIDNPST